MTTRAEEIAAEEYPQELMGHKNYLYFARERAAFVKGYARGQQDARSLAQPPSSGVISAGNVLREVLEYARQTHNRNGEHGRADEAAQAMAILAAISEPDAHPKDPAPTVDQIMDVVDDCVDMQDGDGSCCVVAVLDFDKLSTRLKTLLP